jgi:pimeloyl-ACP methyl ester carboxylesterase
MCRPAENAVVVSNGEARITVRTVGTGAPVLMIPSLARGVADFQRLATDLAARGRMAILPDPRGIDASSGPTPGGLGDLADDAAAVIAELCDGPVDVVGHAFGQRVTRMLAARHPDKVRQVVILAAGGRVAMADDVRQSLITSLSEGSRPDDERLQALQHVFFAAGQDPSPWLTGWTPEAAAAQAAATQATNIDEWWGGGSAPILAVQAVEDPIAPAANSAQLAAEFGDRIRVVQLPHASHAIRPEQPASVTAVIDAYLSGERDQATLQAAVDRNLYIPIGS